MESPMLRQMFVAASPQLAALSVGGIIGFSNVILEQLKSNDSEIPVDIEIASWIGSTHGLAGLPSIAMPLIMQWRGRKFSYIICCLIIITGWILIYLARSASTIIIGECFHGLGMNSIAAISFSTISEMLDPKYRTISLTCYIINQTLGITVTGIIGRFVHWKTVCIIMNIPIILALIIGFMWPESPAWLAYKRKYEKCERAFKWLRGSNESSLKELKELLNARKEDAIASRNTRFKLRSVWKQITRRDFYMPCFHIFMILCPFYFGGASVIVVYGLEIMKIASNSLTAARYGMISVSIISYLGVLVTMVLLNFFRNKTVLIFSGLSAATSMLAATVGSLLQSVGVLSNDSLIVVFLLQFYTLFVCLGLSTLSFAISGELMPVKHRGVGEIVYIILMSILHTLVLKICPYLILYIGLWKLFLLFAIVKVVCMLYIWRYVPETKGKTLQQIEDFYNYGHFVTRNDDDGENMDENCKLND